MVEPFFDATGEGVIHTKMGAQKFKDLRDYALWLPKFGSGNTNDEVRLATGVWHSTEITYITKPVIIEIFGKISYVLST